MPYDFRNKSFQKVLRGYSPEEVDDYIAYFNEEYKKLERRNADNERKLALAQKKIDEYLNGSGVNTENTVNQAKEAAARILRDGEVKRDRIIAEAERKALETAAAAEKNAEEKAAAILDDAAAKATAILESAQSEAALHNDDVRRMKEAANEIYGEVNNFREKLFALYNAHLDTIDKITEASDDFISEINVSVGDSDADIPESVPESGAEINDEIPDEDPSDSAVLRSEDDPTAFMDHLFSDPDDSDNSAETDEIEAYEETADTENSGLAEPELIDGTVYDEDDTAEDSDIADARIDESEKTDIPVDIYIDPLDELDELDDISQDDDVYNSDEYAAEPEIDDEVPNEETDFNRNDGFEEDDYGNQNDASDLGDGETIELDDSDFTELPPIGIDWKNKSAYDSSDSGAIATEADDFKPADGFDADFGEDDFDDNQVSVLGESSMDPDFEDDSVVKPDISDFADEESELDAIFEGRDKSDGDMSLTEEFNIIFSDANSKRNIEEIRKQPTAVPEAPKKQKKHQKNN